MISSVMVVAVATTAHHALELLVAMVDAVRGHRAADADSRSANKPGADPEAERFLRKALFLDVFLVGREFRAEIGAITGRRVGDCFRLVLGECSRKRGNFGKSISPRLAWFHESTSTNGRFRRSNW